MNQTTKWIHVIAGVLFASLLSTGVALGAEETLYLKNNIHAQQGRHDIKASYANWTDPGDGHRIIPVNTPVIFQKGGHIRRSIFTIVLPDSNEKILFEFDKRRMGMEPETYWKLIAGPSQVNLKSLSDIDQKGIREGKAFVGMTKDGVRMALGYPAVHKTPSLKEDRWVYWTNRFRSVAVTFGPDGRVTAAH
jgi:hypothetical protein